MVKEELIEGLKLAVSKGEPLEHAMATFYNSGYKKEDIEEAAASMGQQFYSPPYSAYSGTAAASQPKPVQQQQPFSPQGSISQQPVNPLIQQPQIVQRVSNYGNQARKTRRSSTVITVILVIMLFLLLAVLAALFIFRSQISSLLNGFWRALL